MPDTTAKDDLTDRRKLLIVEDDPGLQKQLKWSFSAYDVVLASDRPSALRELEAHRPAVVTLDLGLPPDPANASEGLVAIRDILNLAPLTKIIVVTGNDERENAVKAVGMGAYDFYQKPIDPTVLGLIVDRAFRLHDLETENRRLAEANRSPLQGIIASSPAMLQVLKTIEKVAPTSATVLLLGESGTGKELLARALHDLSPRKDRRFVAINCAAIPETLLESELFGYEKGAFTGAAKQTLGKIEIANGGTLFLDEIGDLPPALQSKLLRFLQERVIERLGGRTEIPVDVRIICATHRDLQEQIKQGQFREDLFYRVSEISVAIPPLRDRGQDAVLLARALLQKYARVHDKNLRDFTPDAIRAIELYSWPGNAREIENKVKRAVIMAEGQRLSEQDLDLDKVADSATTLPLRTVRERAEKDAIQKAINRCGGKMSRVAELLEISRPTLYDLIDRYGLSPKD
jgi:two-component system NtrC family response regulator